MSVTRGLVLGLCLVGAPGAGAVDLPVLERRVFELTNKERVDRGLPALGWDDQAWTAARGHSEDMGRLRYMGHESPTRGLEKPAGRVWAAGITATTHGENVGLHSVSGLKADALAERLVRGWMDSPHHRDNILSPRFTHLGVGAADGTYQGMDSVLLTQTFLGRVVTGATLSLLSKGRIFTSLRVSGRLERSASLVVYWKEGEETRFEDVAGKPGSFTHEFRLPARGGRTEILLGFKTELRNGGRTEYRFDFTDHFFVDPAQGRVEPVAVPPGKPATP